MAMTKEEKRAARREAARKWRAAHPEGTREASRKYREANREARRESGREYQRKYREAHRNIGREARRDYNRKYRETPGSHPQCPESDGPVRCQKREIVINVPCRLTQQDLVRMLQEIS